MLSLEKIKDLRRYTESINVLKVACKLTDSDIQYAIRLYSILEEKELHISKEFADIIVESYIIQRLINNKITIEKLVESSEFRKKISILTEIELKKYMELCDKGDFNGLLINENIIINYSPEDHFAIISMYPQMSTKNAIIKNIFFAALDNKCSPSIIRIIIKLIEQHLTLENSEEIVKLLTSKTFYELYPDIDILEICTCVISAIDIRELSLLVNIALSGCWINSKFGIKFSQIADIAHITNSTNLILLEKAITYNLEYDDIVEMIILNQESTHLVDFFTDDFLSNHLSHEQRISLTQEFELNSPKNYDKFTAALNIIRQLGIRESLYADLRKMLYKDVYETTVSEYLASCRSISEFIIQIEQNFNNSDHIDTNSTLLLKNF